MQFGHQKVGMWKNVAVCSSKDGFLYKSMEKKKKKRVCTSTCPIKKLKKRGLIACHIYFSTSKDLVYLH
jgi:hypothetical protein